MTRLPLKKMILNEVDNHSRGYLEELAKVAGYSKGGNLTKVLDDESKEFEKFNSLVNLVNYVFPNDSQRLLEEYSKTLDPNNKTARAMLEYLCNNRILDSMKELIDKMIECSNKDSREWAKVYSIQYNWQINYYALDVNEYLKSLKEIKTKIPELKTYLKILQCYGYYQKKVHTLAYELSQELLEEIDQIKEEYLKDVYRTKINEILSYIELRVLNNPTKARKQAEMILDSFIGNTHKAYAHYTIGCSYFYESYDNAKDHYLKSIEIYNEISRENAAKDIREILDLLNIVWNKETNEITNHTYLRYYEIKNNVNVHNEINKNEHELPYYYLLIGMKENNTDMLMQSMIQFLKKGDSFFANLPKIELLNRNYSQIIIDELINIYKA